MSSEQMSPSHAYAIAPSGIHALTVASPGGEWTFLRAVAFLGLVLGVSTSSSPGQSQKPETSDLLSTEALQSWRITSLWRQEPQVATITGETNFALYAANAVHTDAFATVPVAKLEGRWRFSAKINLLRGLAPDGAGYLRLALFEETTPIAVADVSPWHLSEGRAQTSIQYWNGSTWLTVHREPEGQWPSLRGRGPAWVDLSYDPSNRRLAFRIETASGSTLSRLSDPVPETVVPRVSRIGLSCIRSEMIATEVLLTRNFSGIPPNRPRLYTRLLPSRDVVLFWAGEAGVHFSIERTTAFQAWTEVADTIGNDSGEMLSIGINDDSTPTSLFRLSAH